MRTRRTTRRAQVLEAHAVVIGALLSALARLIHRRCRQMRPAAGPACIRCVSPRAHTIPHSTAHLGTCSGAHTCARLPISTCATSHTHTAPLSHALGLTYLCAHAHMHMHTARQTASHTQTGYHRKDTPRHTHAHTHAHTVAYIHTYTHEHTQTHTSEHALIQTHTHIHTRLCDTHMHTHATPVHTHGCLHAHVHT
jgi:hypothetical protein